MPAAKTIGNTSRAENAKIAKNTKTAENAKTAVAATAIGNALVRILKAVFIRKKDCCK